MISSSDILQGKVLIVTLRESISFYSGISGGFVPLILKRLGADPVIASGIIPRHRHWGGDGSGEVSDWIQSVSGSMKAILNFES